MSLGARATKGGAKAGKEGKAQEKGKGGEKTQPKEKVKPQATTEQLRMANMIDRQKDDAFDVRRMVQELMEMTCRTEEEVCSALHDADNDMQGACNLLLEESKPIQGEWQTSEKKKKKPAPPVSNGEVEPPRDPRSRSGPRPRRGEGMGGGATRGRGRGRGAGGGATRGRGRGGRRPAPDHGSYDSQPHDHMHGPGHAGDSFPTTEDWDNEEWSGSLTDTKVFTPSVSTQAEAEASLAQANSAAEDWDNPPEGNNSLATHIPTYTYHNACAPPPANNTQAQLPRSVAAAAAKPDPPLEPHSHTQPIPHPVQPMGMSGSLTAAQSQYLSQLTQQSQRHDNSVYTSNYGVYGSGDITGQRKPQRARVPPPSKIPSSAVEMPGGGDAGAGFLDVQFGAIEPDLDLTPKQQAPAQPEPQPAPTPTHEPVAETNTYNPNTSSMLSEALSTPLEPPHSKPQPRPQPQTHNTTPSSASVEKQLTSSMKQMSVTSPPPAAAPPAAAPHTQHKTVGQQNVYAAVHAAAHAPPAAVYPPNVYATQQVNSTVGTSLSNPAAMSAAYPSSVTLPQQTMINSYQQQQQQQTTSSVGVYGGAALYTHAPYSAYQPPPHKDISQTQTQYDSSVSSNSLTSTTTQSSAAAKVTTTTMSSAGSNAAYAVAAAAAQASPALYGNTIQQGSYSAYDEQCMRTMPHHMGGYYEVGYGVGGAREGTFGLGAGERFGRADAASPQQVPAALPPGYAYFYQPPPTTYQYGVYPYGGGSSVGGVGGVGAVSGAGKVSTYTQQQPPYDAQDTYKAAGAYNAPAKQSAAGGAAADLSSAMYAKAHVALNKVNSYEKAGFHSGTPPPFGAGSHHLYIPHHHHHHLPHQMDARVNSSQNRRESGQGGAGNTAGGRAGAAGKTAAKPAYSQSYWPPN